MQKVDEVKDFPILKIKVGIKNDVEILKELRKITKAIFPCRRQYRLDG